MLSKNVIKIRYGLRAIFTCLLVILVLMLMVPCIGTAGKKPKTVAEIALYQGADREKILIEGAKREGKLTLYTSHICFRTVAAEFEKLYPFLKVSVWRTGSKKMLKQVVQEYTARRFLIDVIETTDPAVQIFHREGLFQEYYSPEMSYYGESLKAKGKTGVYYLGDRELYIGLGFNTKMVSPAEAPKTYKDLLNPKWKGMMALAGTNTGIRWLGNLDDEMGREFIHKLTRQNLKVFTGSGFALATMVIAAEIPLSPNIYNPDMFQAKRKGAPVEWQPLEPVVTNVGYSGIISKAPHPHASLLFLDYIHSKEGQKIVMEWGLNSPREDIGSVEQKFKKTYLQYKYPLEQLERKMGEWEKLMRQLFIKKR